MYRIGNGYDVHRLELNRKLILGGIEVPSEKGLLGHSDADALIHSIIDAIIGALSLGDIGKFFPDNDEKFKNISSIILLKEIVKILEEKKYKIINCDNIIVLQKPKLRPYIDKMRENISNVLKIPIEDINIKAKTEENLGFVGNLEGIKVYTVILLKKY